EGPDDGADPGDGVQRAVAAAAERQDKRRAGGRDGKGQRAGDVEHAEIFGDLALGGQHVGDQREVDSRIQAETEPADGHADEKAVESAGDRDYEHGEAVHDGGGEDEDLPPTRPVGELATDQGSGDNDDGLGERAEEYLLRHIGPGASELV